MVNASLINRLSHAIDLIETRRQQSRPWKVVEVFRGEDDPDAALDRHFAAHPEDRAADLIIFKFFADAEIADHNEDCTAPAEPACEAPKTTSRGVSDVGRVPAARGSAGR
jgi:hypothetical protein